MFLKRVQAAALGLTIVLAACAAPTQQGSTRSAVHNQPFINVRAMIIVRHADVDIALKRAKGDDTPLLPAGDARAKQLAYAIKDAGVTRVFTSHTVRTMTTAEIATGGKLPIDSAFKHGAEPADILSYIAAHTQPTDTVLLVQNHGTIQGIMQSLGYRDESLINEPVEYDRCYVVLPDAQTHTYHVARLRYGGKWGE